MALDGSDKDFDTLNRRLVSDAKNLQQKLTGQREEKPMPSKEKVWLKFFKSTEMDGQCWCCGDSLKFKNMQRGHKRPRANGSNLLKNFVPLCVHCNSSMRDEPVMEWVRKKHPHREAILKKKGWWIK